MKTPIPSANDMDRYSMIRYLIVRRVLLICGIAASLVWLGADIIASLLYESYNYPFQPISGLSALNSPIRSLVIPLIYLYVVLKIAFAVGIWMTAGQKRSLQITAGSLLAWGVIDLAGYFFPWDPNQGLYTLTNIIHGILAGGLALILMLLAIIFGANANGRWFRYYSYGTLLVFLLAGGVMGLLGNPRMEGNLIPWWFGLAERINTYGFMIWMLALAVILLSTKLASSSLADRESIIHLVEGATEL
jgi:hypothetical protein